MNPQERERLVDSVLDRALGPQLVEPRAGLEERILANLASAPQSRPWWRWMWVPALAAAAVLAVVIGLQVVHRETPAPEVGRKTVEVPKPEVATKPEAPTPHVLESARHAATHTKPRVAPKTAIVLAKAEPLPRMDVFPAPTPLTEQERMLLALVNHQRPQAELVAAEQQAEREKAEKYFETGEAPVVAPVPAQPMR